MTEQKRRKECGIIFTPLDDEEICPLCVDEREVKEDG